MPVHTGGVAEDDACRDQGRVDYESHLRNLDVEGIVVLFAWHEDLGLVGRIG